MVRCGGDTLVMSTRQSVKNAIKATIQDAVGVKSVFLYRPKEQEETDFPSVVITLPKSKETRLTQSAPVGKKLIEFTAQLEVFTIDTTRDGSGALDFDDILDAIDAELRKDPTMGASVLSSTIDHITTNVAPATLVNGQNIALMAIKQFDVTVQVTG